VADLSREGERPALNVSGLLRALVSPAYDGGLDWAPGVQLVVQGADLGDSMPGVAVPEAGGGWTSGAVALRFNGVEIQAGPRGCSVWADTSVAARIIRYASLADAAAQGNTAAYVATPPFGYTVNGAVLTTVRICDFPLGGNGGGAAPIFTRSGSLQVVTPRVWLPAGSIARFFNNLVGAAIEVQLLIREPLSSQ
jgi:hypothetical protein